MKKSQNMKPLYANASNQPKSSNIIATYEIPFNKQLAHTYFVNALNLPFAFRHRKCFPSTKPNEVAIVHECSNSAYKRD